MVTARPSGIRRCPAHIADMTRHQPLACLTLAATIFFAAHALALETLAGEPPVNDSLPVRHHVQPARHPSGMRNPILRNLDRGRCGSIGKGLSSTSAAYRR